MIREIAENSECEGLASSRLPTFTEEWIDRIRGTADFLALNYYAGRYIDHIDRYEIETSKAVIWGSPTVFPSAPGLISLIK